MWKELYVNMGVNVLITSYTNIESLDKTKRQLAMQEEYDNIAEFDD
jgi:hypothetical protein